MMFWKAAGAWNAPGRNSSLGRVSKPAIPGSAGGGGGNDAAGLIQQKSRWKDERLAEGLFRHVAVNLEQMLLFCKSLQA